MTIIIPCSLGNSYCTFGFLIFIIDERNFLYYSLYILTEKSLKHLCSMKAWVPVSFSLALSLQLIPWSTETRLAHSTVWASKTLSRRCPVPSPCLERVPSTFMRDASPVLRTLLVFCINQGVSASFSLSLSYRRLQTARSRSIKGPQHFTLIKRLFSSSSLSAIRVVSSEYLRLFYISPGNLSSLCFIQPGILHDALCI